MSRATAWAVGVCVGGAVGLFRSGMLSYAFPRSRERVQVQLNSHAPLKELEQSGLWTERRQPWVSRRDHMPAKVLDVGGGVASPVVFFDRKNPRRIVLFTHCGGKTCGFPFIVHGGVLGTIIAEALALATPRSLDRPALPLKHLEIRYKRPTLAGQVLRVDTQPTECGLKATITDKYGNTLVEATSQ